MNQPSAALTFDELFDDPASFSDADGDPFCENCEEHVAECLCEIDDDFEGEWEE